MEAVTLVIAAITFVCFFIYFSRKDKRMPPGPPKWPIIGNLFTLLPRDYAAYTQWKKEYGEIITVYLGPSSAVVLNSYKAINEAFIGQADIFSGREKLEYFDIMTHKSGIILKDGPLWQEHRRLTLRLLRDYGLGRDAGETIVLEECEALCEKLDTLTNKDVTTRDIFTSAINNVIARIIFGERCGSEDPNFKEFSKHLDIVTNLRFIDLVPLIFPIILRIPPLLHIVENASQLRFRIEKMHSYIREKIDARMKVLQSSTSPPTDISEATNLCEAYLIEQSLQEKRNPGAHTFTEWQIIRNMLELFLAGTETTSTTLTWATLLLAIHPEIQKKVQHEIADKIGRDRHPVMSDLKELPYVHAVMDEVLRYASFIPANINHRTMQDTQVMGYFIPEGTTIASNLHGIHHDPDLWSRPEEFYPEHFLSEDGEYRPSKYLIPFSIGKRACLGEGLARMEYFLALTSLMQRFNVRLNDNDKSRVDEILIGNPGNVLKPCLHHIIFLRIDANC